MRSIDRYTMYPYHEVTDSGETLGIEIIRHPKGDFVRYSDFESFLKELELYRNPDIVLLEAPPEHWCPRRLDVNGYAIMEGGEDIDILDLHNKLCTAFGQEDKIITLDE